MHLGKISKLALISLQAGVLGLTACGAAPGDDAAGDDVQGEPPVASVQEEIYTWNTNSTSNQRGAIQIYFHDTGINCSGAILNNYVIVTAAHCLNRPNRNEPQSVTISYPFGGFPRAFDIGADFIDRRMFFYHHPKQTESNRYDVDPEWDVAIGAICRPNSSCLPNTTQSFNLPETHFSMLSLRALADNMGLTVNGYGAPESGVQHQMSIRAEDAHTDYIDWEHVYPDHYMCSGDSGAPGFRNSGYSDALGPYWQSVAAVMGTVHTNLLFQNLPGVKCGDTGRAANIRGKTAWIADIVSFWSRHRCPQFTNPAGEQSMWCWAN